MGSIHLTGDTKSATVFITENNIEYLQLIRGIFEISFERTAEMVANGHEAFTISMTYTLN